LARRTAAVRREFHGPVSYTALVWEAADWSLFDMWGSTSRARWGSAWWTTNRCSRTSSRWWAGSSGHGLKGAHVRDEALQAREITEALGILEAAGVNGALVCTFVEPIAPFSENPTPCPSPEVGPVVASGLRKRQSRCRVRT